MADPPEFLGFVWDIWFSVSKPGLERTQWADSLIRNLANLELSNSLADFKIVVRIVYSSFNVLCSVALNNSANLATINTSTSIAVIALLCVISRSDLSHELFNQVGMDLLF
ncbi:MAG: hypothetical protein EZS28_033677 [Streblomastix strix]|uniref:Uncharacterized protein n=1 Tax=Streblomastix strix TaxID=222440 RepID=A0A5J4UK58_9EUKA|nr:MAG: hypothetical protein EZS28_033677 [Streblomastix strix]